MIGRIVGLEETRRLFVIRDTKGNIDEMLPEAGSEDLRLQLILDLPSGRTLEFSVQAPVEIHQYLGEIKVPRSVPELTEQLVNDLNGVEDEHDKAIKQAEGGRSIEQLKRDLLEQIERSKDKESP